MSSLGINASEEDGVKIGDDSSKPGSGVIEQPGGVVLHYAQQLEQLDLLLGKIDSEEPRYMKDANGFSLCAEIRGLKAALVGLIQILKSM